MNTRFKNGFRFRNGFTLLELIVVITIIGILGTMVVLKVGGLTGKAKEKAIRHDLQAIMRAANLFQASTGRFPESLEELKTGKLGDTGEDVGFTVEKTTDPWNNEYLYELTSDGTPIVRCLGADGMDGGEGENQDYTEPESGLGDDFGI